MADDPQAPTPDQPADPAEPVHPEHDVFEGLVLDENFIRGGAYEPPHRTREAIGKFKDDQASARYGAPLRPVDNPNRADRKATRKARANRAPMRAGRRELASWLPLTAALTVVALLLIFRR
jgi:hypothetical protein